MIMFAYGAYGREATMDDWNSGKDFSIGGTVGPYFSIRDRKVLQAEGYTEIWFLNKTHFIHFVEKLS